jgi:hypothetical protein
MQQQMKMFFVQCGLGVLIVHDYAWWAPANATNPYVLPATDFFIHRILPYYTL